MHHQLVRFRCPSLQLYRGNHVESRVAQQRACCSAFLGKFGGVTRFCYRGAEQASHIASRILSPWCNDAEKSKAAVRVEVRSASALGLGLVRSFLFCCFAGGAHDLGACMRFRVLVVLTTCPVVYFTVSAGWFWRWLRRHVGLPGFVMDGRPCVKNFVVGWL